MKRPALILSLLMVAGLMAGSMATSTVTMTRRTLVFWRR